VNESLHGRIPDSERLHARVSTFNQVVEATDSGRSWKFKAENPTVAVTYSRLILRVSPGAPRLCRLVAQIGTSNWNVGVVDLADRATVFDFDLMVNAGVELTFWLTPIGAQPVYSPELLVLELHGSANCAIEL